MTHYGQSLTPMYTAWQQEQIVVTDMASFLALFDWFGMTFHLKTGFIFRSREYSFVWYQIRQIWTEIRSTTSRQKIDVLEIVSEISS